VHLVGFILRNYKNKFLRKEQKIYFESDGEEKSMEGWVRKYEGKTKLRRPSCRWEANVRRDLKGTE